MKREERKVTIELLEVERMNTYKILAEFFARKFNERGFDKEKEKWFNKGAAKNSGNCNVQIPTSENRKKKEIPHIEISPFPFFIQLIS